MNIKAIYIGAALAVCSSSVGSAGALDVLDSLNHQSIHTGAIAKAVPSAKFKAAFMAMPKPKRDAVVKECQNPATSKFDSEFCMELRALPGF